MARRYFLTYYALADPRDARLIDTLILTRSALQRGIDCPRNGLPPHVSDGIARITDETERTFTKLRNWSGDPPRSGGYHRRTGRGSSATRSA